MSLCALHPSIPAGSGHPPGPRGTQFVRLDPETGYKANRVVPALPGGAAAGAGGAAAAFGMPGYAGQHFRRRTDLNAPEDAKFPSEAGPKDWIK